MKIDGKTILVTGTGTGIGRATARRLASEGATPVVTDLHADRAAETADLLADEGYEADWYELDVRDFDACRECVATVADERDGLDGLVNNAGVDELTRFETATPADRDRVVETNVTGTWNATRAAIPSLLAADGGVIVNVASVAGFLGWEYRTTYCLSKGAVLNFTRALAMEYAADGLRVNAVCPGTINTDRIDRFFEEKLPSFADVDPELARRRSEAEYPLGRFGEPDEVAAAITFLASDDASFITGHGLVVDGGYSVG
ncbi:MAG: SDR family NAD(P)-dependent oxidoreductase [Halobaculum sp.]